MAAELGFLSSTQLQKLKSTNTSGGAWMWNHPNQQTMGDQESEDSWEVRAFEEDTNNAMGTTWPPRSYTCTFCRREFRSAQALGGHMNVHRRDRARLHQGPPSITTGSTTALIMNPTHHQEIVAHGGLILYSLPNPNAHVFSPTKVINHCIESSIPPYPTTNFMLPNSPHPHPRSSINFPAAAAAAPQPHSINSSLGHSTNTEHSVSTINDNFNEDCKKQCCEIDLELRLGCGSSQS